MNSIPWTSSMLFLTTVLSQFSFCQESSLLHEQNEQYRMLIDGRQNSHIAGFDNPTVNDFVRHAQEAILKLDTRGKGRDADVKRLARRLDNKLSELLTNDVGRWIATDERNVRLFIQFDTDHLLLSDKAISDRMVRLIESAQALKNHNSTQGKFEPKNSEAVKAILADANWATTMHERLSNRLSIFRQVGFLKTNRLNFGLEF